MKQNAGNNYLLWDNPHDVYFANPEGFTESGRNMVQNVVLPTLVAGGVSVYEPFREFHARAVQKFGKFDISDRETVLFGSYANAQAIKSAKLVVAVLDWVDVDSGTASEIWFAAALGIRVLGIRTDFRWNSADSTAVKVNMQVEWFIEMSGGAIYDSYAKGLSAAIKYIIGSRTDRTK